MAYTAHCLGVAIVATANAATTAAQIWQVCQHLDDRSCMVVQIFLDLDVSRIASNSEI